MKNSTDFNLKTNTANPAICKKKSNSTICKGPGLYFTGIFSKLIIRIQVLGTVPFVQQINIKISNFTKQHLCRYYITYTDIITNCQSPLITESHLSWKVTPLVKSSGRWLGVLQIPAVGLPTCALYVYLIFVFELYNILFIMI